MATSDDLINFAIDKNPIDFASAFDDIMREKTLEALEAKKVELAHSIYGNDDTDEDLEDDGSEEFEINPEDIDDSDEDIEDFELDDIDIDLDDIDLGAEEDDIA